jgi:hypothetical protein
MGDHCHFDPRYVPRAQRRWWYAREPLKRVELIHWWFEQDGRRHPHTESVRPLGHSHRFGECALAPSRAPAPILPSRAALARRNHCVLKRRVVQLLRFFAPATAAQAPTCAPTSAAGGLRLAAV